MAGGGAEQRLPTLAGRAALGKRVEERRSEGSRELVITPSYVMQKSRGKQVLQDSP